MMRALWQGLINFKTCRVSSFTGKIGSITFSLVSVRAWVCVGKQGTAEFRKDLLNLDSHLCSYSATQDLRRDERRAGLRRLRQQRQRQTAPVAHRAGGLRQIPRPRVGERGEDHLQDTVEARRQTGLQPGRGCRTFQGNPRPPWVIFQGKTLDFRCARSAEDQFYKMNKSS